MSVLTLAMNTVKNYKPDPSVLAGGAASLLVYIAGCALVGAGIAIPGIGPITMTMVAAASPAVGHIVTYLVPDSMKTSLQKVAQKLDTTIDQIKVVTPEVEYKYPTPTALRDSPGN